MKLREQQTTLKKTASPQVHSGMKRSRLPISPLAMRTPANLQPKLMVNAPGDRYEQEADRVADQVMRMPEPGVQRLCTECEAGLPLQPLAEEEEEDLLQMKPIAGTVSPLIQRQTEPMEEEAADEEEFLQAKAASGEPATVSSGLQNQIMALQGGGQPLSSSERHFFEPRFGTDFSQVRIHTDGQAAEAASAVNARAFTLGQDVVFGSGQYQSHTSEGRYLLSHELTHTLQQQSSRKSWIARKLPLPLVKIVKGQNPIIKDKDHGHIIKDDFDIPRIPTGPTSRYARIPRNLDELGEMMRRHNNVMASKRPFAVLSRGGSAPLFITEREQEGYTIRKFHILDAIEHDVMQAISQEDLVQVLRVFIPGALPEEDWSTFTIPWFDRRLFEVRFPENFDPGSEIRLGIFWESVARRNRQLLQTDSESAYEIERRRTILQGNNALKPQTDVDFDLAYGQCDEYGCEIEPIAQQFGRYPCHADFARLISGVSREFRITTPEGLSADFDAMDWGGRLYEVKTGYRWVPFTPHSQSRQAVIWRFIEQSEHQLQVAERCHRPLDWYFNDEQAANFFEPFIQVPTHYVQFDCQQDSDEHSPVLQMSF